jgi:hypothetical protein
MIMCIKFDTVKCAADIMNFPFDSHSCQLRFAGWGYNGSIAIIPWSKSVSLLYFEDNRDWKLEGTSILTNFSHQSLFYVILNRLSSKYNKLTDLDHGIIAMLPLYPHPANRS